MTPEQQAEQQRIFKIALMNNDDALFFCNTLFHICDVWDDLIDKDKELDSWTIHRAFYDALVVLPRINFYRQHFAELNPTIESLIQAWWLSTHLEKCVHNDALLQTANVLRCRAFDIITKSAMLIGGAEHAYKIAPVLSKVCYDETLEEYKKGLGI